MGELPCSLRFDFGKRVSSSGDILREEHVGLPVMPRSRSTLSLSKTCWFRPLSFLVIVPVNCSKVNIRAIGSVIQNYTSSSLMPMLMFPNYMRDMSELSTYRSARVDLPWSGISSFRIGSEHQTLYEDSPMWAMMEKFLQRHMNLIFTPMKLVTSSRT